MKNAEGKAKKRRRTSQHDEQRKTGGLVAFKIIFSFTRPADLLYLIPAFSLAVLSGLFKPVMSILTGRFFNTFSQFAGRRINGDKLAEDTWPVILGLVGLGAGIWLVKGGFCCAWIAYGESQARAVREVLFSTLLVRDIEWFESQESGVGTLLSRIQVQIRDFQLGVSQTLGLATISAVQAIVSLGVAFYHSWKLTLVLLSTFPVVAFVLSFISRGMQQETEAQQKQLTLATKHVVHALSHISVLKCHNTQAAEAKNYAAILRSLTFHFHRQTRIVATQNGFMRLTGTAVLTIALYFGDHLIHNANTSTGEVTTTFWCCVTATSSFNDILTQILVLEKGRAAALALRLLLRRVRRGKASTERVQGLTPLSLEGDIEFRAVSFAYPSRPEHHVLRDATFFFPAHETTYVVGKSGSGKSTLSTLLLKFYSASTGKVMVDGYDIRGIDTSWLRNNVTFVQQDSILFNDTMYNNITICEKQASPVTPTQLADSLAFSALEETVNSLATGLNTKVGKGGTSLSGGQRQRIALARARLRDTPVLILDESTSALDETAKIRVMRNIREWRKDKTTVVITHDLSQIRSGDFVYVLKDGHIVSEGYRSTVKAALEETEDFDMIGSPLTPLQDVSMLSPRMQERIDRGLRPSPLHAQDSASNTSMESLASSSMADEHANLLSGSPPQGRDKKAGPKFRHTLLPARVSIRPTKQHTRSHSNVSMDTLDIEYEMAHISRSRRLHKRLTSIQNPRPFSIQPSITVMPTYEQQDVAPPLSNRPITIWDDINRIESSIAIPPSPSDSPPTKSTSVLSVGQILQTVWSAFSPRERVQLAIALVSAAAYAALPSISAWIMVHLFKTFQMPKGWVQEARKWSLIMLAVGFVDCAAAFTIRYLFEALSQSWANHLRRSGLAQILRQPKSWFDRDELSITEICNTIDKAAEDVRDLLSRFVSFALIALVMITVAVIWSLVTCWKLTLVSIACAPPIYIVAKVFNIVSTRWESRTTDAAEEVSDTFAESFSDLRTVRALTLESHFHRKYTAEAAKAFQIGLKRGVYIGICFGASDGTLPFVTACIFSYGIKLAKTKEYTPQSVMTVFAILLMAMMGASAILGFIPQISSSVDAGNRLLRLVHLPLTSHEQQGDVRLDREGFTGKVEFTSLTFSYPTRPETVVLKHFSLTIEAGQCVSVVGQSGCGKSTIISLLLGLYPVGYGLQVSSHDMTTIQVSSLRDLIAYVPQQPALFSMSIRENILYGLGVPISPQYSTIESAARSAGIHDFIISLPSGYDTIVGDGGLGVSGGQAQRIVLARAFARRPKILLMDEPTSALDSESAEIIKDSIQRLKEEASGNRPTIVIVTHSRDMMELADKVVVLENGSVAEEGRFESMLEKRGALFRLLNGNEE